jgi:hypothetical protein
LTVRISLVTAWVGQGNVTSLLLGKPMDVKTLFVAVHNINTKTVLQECICEFGRQEITENSYFFFILLISHVHLLDLVLQNSLNISGVPFNTPKPAQNGRIWGGKPSQIGNQPHQVTLLNCC